MYLDSSQNAVSSNSIGDWLWRLVLAIALGLGITLAMGATAWSRAPYSDSEIKSVEKDDESKIREIRNQEVTQLRIALGRRAPTNRRADLYFRLAEIYLESYRHFYLMEGRVHEKRLEQNQEDKTIDHSRSNPYLSLGIKACNEVIGLKIPYSKLDQIYYFLGFNYGQLGNKKESIRGYEFLIKNYPNSTYAGEAYRELGDAAYETQQYRKSVAYYEMASHRGNPETLPRVYHKLAWSYYRTKQFDRAVDTMKQAIDGASKSGEKFLNLKEEALRDMAVFMTETGRADEAIAYFQTVVNDKTFYPKVLEKLGRQYERNVEPIKATQVYESLLKTHPDDESSFRVLVKLVDLDLRRGKYKEALNRFQASSIPSSGDQETMTAAQNLRAMVRRTATEHHEGFRKKGERSGLDVAELYYTAYLSRFLSKDDPRKEIPEIEMYLAEVKRELGKAKEASQLYRKVLESKDKRYAKEAGVLWTASLADAMKKAPTKTADPSELEKEFVDAADKLQENLGDMPEVRESSLKAAQVLAGYKSSQKDAIKRIKLIVEKWPKSNQALTAARLWIQIYTDQLPAAGSGKEDSSEALEELKEIMATLRKNTWLMASDHDTGGKLKAQMADLDARMRIGTIAKEERNKDFGSAAKGYETFAAEATQKDLAEKAYANAVTAYIKAGEFESIDRVTASWLKRFPKSPKAAESIRSAATGVLIRGSFDVAGKLFEKIGRDAGDAGAMMTAARIFEGNGDKTKAQQIWAAFLQQHPKENDRWTVALSLARLQESLGFDAEASKAYKYCMAGPPDVEAECAGRLADLYFKNKNEAEGKNLLKRLADTKTKKKAKISSPYVAYARFRLAAMAEEGTHFEPLQLPEAQLKKAMNQRLQFLEPLSRSYLTAVEAGGPWGVAALDRLAAWAMGFADEVDKIPPPKTATPAAVEQFRKNLKSISDPLRKKAISTWLDAYKKAVSNEILSPALPILADRLSDYQVTNPGRAQGPRGKFRLAGMPADGGPEGQVVSFQKVRDKLLKNPQDAASWVDYGNLIWGMNKPLLAKIAYERALSLNSKNPIALNNQGVVLISSDGEEDWFTAEKSAYLFREALKHDDFFLPAKMNLASIYNYYRIFPKAKPLWDQVLAKNSSADVEDGLGVALQGIGSANAAESAFKRATDEGGNKGRFANVYHEAARMMGTGSADKCLSRIEDIKSEGLSGFEKAAIENLKRTCSQWKKDK